MEIDDVFIIFIWKCKWLGIINLIKNEKLGKKDLKLEVIRY